MTQNGGVSGMGVGEFTARLVDIALDLTPIGEAFGRWGVEHYREWELCCDALVLQWYATQNFLALKAAEGKFDDPLLNEIIRTYNHHLGKYVIPGGIDPEMKLQVMGRIKNHRPNYDKLITAGKNRSFMGSDYQTDIGNTFAFISGNMGSFKVRKLGSELYRTTLGLCQEQLGTVRLAEAGDKPE
jgi:hypothetical protein